MYANIDSQLDSAHGAFVAARKVAPVIRAKWLENIAISLGNNTSKLVETAHEETNLPLPRLENELNRTIFQVNFLAQELRQGEIFDVTIDHADSAWGMGPRPDIRRQDIALGVVGVFGSSNFPFAFSVMGGDSAAGLAAGCAVVHKIHEAHPRLGALVAEIVVSSLQEVGAPSGLFSVIHSREEGEALVNHPLVRAIGFTGSLSVGRSLMSQAMSREDPIPFYGELGSINPVFITSDAWNVRASEIIDGFVNSYNMGVGQFCTKPGLIFVPRLSDEQLQQLVRSVQVVSPSIMLSDSIENRFYAVRDDLVKLLGLTLVAQGSRGPGVETSLYRTNISDFLKHAAELQTELFGPASIVVEYSNQSELLLASKKFSGQLTATIHAEDHENVGDLLDLLEQRTGRVIWNSWPTGVTVSYAQHHGGPYPATTAAAATSVGSASIARFMRPVAYQGMPQGQLPPALKDSNPWNLPRRVNGVRHES